MSREGKTRAKNEAGRIIVEEINNFLDGSNSPVKGQRTFAKKDDGSNSILLEFGDMRESIEFRNRSGDQIEVGIWRSSERPKGYNHTTGDTVPRRAFIPGESEEFKQSIQNRINRQINSIKEFERAESELETNQITLADLIDAGSAPTVTTTTESSILGSTFTLGDLFGDDDG